MIGFVAGAAAAVVGDDEPTLHAELLRLQQQAGRYARSSAVPNAGPEPKRSGRELAILSIHDLTAPRVDFHPPSLDFLDSTAGPGIYSGPAELSIQPYGTIEELLELVRKTVSPGAWRTETISPIGSSLLLWAQPELVQRTRAFLDSTLRPPAHRGVVVDLEVRSGSDPAGRRLLALRAAGTLGSRFYVWHGGQTALWIDSDVVVATRATTADPVVDVARTGGLLAVRAAEVEGSNDLTLDLDLHIRGLVEARRRETRKGGTLDLPVIEDQRASLTLRAPRDRWVVAAANSSRTLRVRASLVERGATR
ncbi:MAG: hypothetical protein ACYS0E_00105 [Planctomycetota bacterium]